MFLLLLHLVAVVAVVRVHGVVVSPAGVDRRELVGGADGLWDLDDEALVRVGLVLERDDTLTVRSSQRHRRGPEELHRVPVRRLVRGVVVALHGASVAAPVAAVLRHPGESFAGIGGDDVASIRRVRVGNRRIVGIRAGGEGEEGEGEHGGHERAHGALLS